jgi:lactobin A/cerein 7B family class IIb bacteriocin
MEQLNNKELQNIYGGGISFGFIFAIAGLITFAIGILDGYIRPLKCNT